MDISYLQGMGLITNFILYFDSFTAPATLRTKDGGQTNSMCTGLFSLALTGIFLWIIVAKSMEITQFQKVQATFLVEDELTRLKKAEVMFAMNVFEEHGELVNNRYFQFYAYVMDKQENIIEQAKLELCKLSQWNGTDEKMLTESYDIEEWLCPSKPLSMQGLEVVGMKDQSTLKLILCKQAHNEKVYGKY